MKQKTGHWLPIAAVLQFGVLASFAQSYLFTGSETTITLNPGIYDITAYGAQGGSGYDSAGGALGAEMEGEFSFSTSATLTLLVGGGGGRGGRHHLLRLPRVRPSDRRGQPGLQGGPRPRDGHHPVVLPP